MSSTTRRNLVILVSLAVASIAARPASAQHHGGHGFHHGHGSFHHGGHYGGWSHHHHFYSPPVYVRTMRPVVDSAVISRPLTPVVSPAKLEFGGFGHVDALATRLETEANRWCLDMHANYHHNPGFAETYVEAYKILQAAQYVHSAEHRYDRPAIRAELVALDPLFHHVQEKIKSWTRQQTLAVGDTGINGKAEAIESILHHLLYDVGIQVQHGGGATEVPGQAPAPQAPPPLAAK